MTWMRTTQEDRRRRKRRVDAEVRLHFVVFEMSAPAYHHGLASYFEVVQAQSPESAKFALEASCRC